MCGRESSFKSYLFAKTAHTALPTHSTKLHPAPSSLKLDNLKACCGPWATTSTHSSTQYNLVNRNHLCYGTVPIRACSSRHRSDCLQRKLVLLRGLRTLPPSAWITYQPNSVSSFTPMRQHAQTSSLRLTVNDWCNSTISLSVKTQTFRDNALK